MASTGEVANRENGSNGHLPLDAAADERKQAATALIETHDAVFRRTARRYSICADDSEDAYQRAFEILLTKAPPIEGESLVRWMQTVTKREALAVRRQRERLLSGPRSPSDEERDPLDAIASESPEPTDRAASRERVARSNEALRALKPQEVRALTLKAEGYSYTEIAEITGWTYTKINRCMAEGRKRFLQVFAEIEQGRRCEEVAAALSAVADGEAGAPESDTVEIHLRSCGACRAKLRAFRAIPQRVLELIPAGPLLDQSIGGRAHGWITERAGAIFDKARETSYSTLTRGGSEDAVRVASSGGGTRGAGMAALAKVLAVCGATAAGGATCVATGLVDPGAVGIGGGRTDAAIERSDRPVEQPVDRQSVSASSGEAAAATSTEAAPPLTRAQQATRELGIESAGAAPSSGGEFGAPAGGRGAGGGGSGGSSGGFGIE